MRALKTFDNKCEALKAGVGSYEIMTFLMWKGFLEQTHEIKQKLTDIIVRKLSFKCEKH